MYRLKLMILLSFFGTSALWAQDADTGNDTGDTAETAETAAEEAVTEESPEPEDDVSDEEIDELLGLDEDYSELEDDDFDFSEDVRFEQSTDFPADI